MHETRPPNCIHLFRIRLAKKWRRIFKKRGKASKMWKRGQKLPLHFSCQLETISIRSLLFNGSWSSAFGRGRLYRTWKRKKRISKTISRVGALRWASALLRHRRVGQSEAICAVAVENVVQLVCSFSPPGHFTVVA
jgi:hypothetical protein